MVTNPALMTFSGIAVESRILFFHKSGDAIIWSERKIKLFNLVLKLTTS